MLTTYEQCNPELYQDRFKHQVTLIDTEDAEDSGDDQEVAVAEWTRGVNPVSYKWVKQQGPTKGFDFNMSKVEQIFDLLLKEKLLKLAEGCKLPIAQELQGRSIASGIILSLTTLATARNSIGRSNRLWSKAD
jgi:hypothetical protein